MPSVEAQDFALDLCDRHKKFLLESGTNWEQEK